ncbi:hypothetical protein GCM10017771_57120 [Streptomyces capitiformicae]|uniref:Uncharacterized protein n=1 Tax=Streptomyces capitiformicae TaxID=2014920 RepID=A0A918Z6V7_9ACTN|nr:hypothetical protein GCM10017771_57120 [Streptomyces capitiformicae]
MGSSVSAIRLVRGEFSGELAPRTACGWDRTAHRRLRHWEVAPPTGVLKVRVGGWGRRVGSAFADAAPVVAAERSAAAGQWGHRTLTEPMRRAPRFVRAFSA